MYTSAGESILPERNRFALSLIQDLHKRATSPNLVQRFPTFWISARLDKHISCCNDHEIANLLRQSL
jgi:hypothetical protein